MIVHQSWDDQVYNKKSVCGNIGTLTHTSVIGVQAVEIEQKLSRTWPEITPPIILLGRLN